jgi:phosphatidylglycerophosphate synthase
MTEGAANRRPLASRNRAWARRSASWLAARGVSPDRISQGAILAALLGAAVLCGAPYVEGAARSALLLLAALACQLRLLCNLLDGMVAVEGGQGGPEGPFWNEAPDRLADVLFLVTAGVAAGMPFVGAGAALAALGTAYLRELRRAEGLGADFCGPMAKQHRMAVLTAGLVVAAVLPDRWTATVLSATLTLIVVGASVTILRRAQRLRLALRART